MKKLIKDLSIGLGLLTAVLVLSGCSNALPNPFAKNDSQNQDVSLVGQPVQDKPETAKNDDNKPVTTESIANLEPAVIPAVTASEVLSSVKDAFECGQTCKDATCKEVRECLTEHAADCTSAKGKVVYPIPSDSTRKKAIQHVIVGKVGEDCSYKGVHITESGDINTPTLITFECKKPAEILKQMFADGNFEKFSVANCSGTYVDFMKTKIK